MLEDTNGSAFRASTSGNRNNSVEVYLNATAFSGSGSSGRLKLADDYIMYICMEGDFFNNSSLSFSSDIQHFVDGSTTKYRTGWLDCQVKKSSTITSSKWSRMLRI